MAKTKSKRSIKNKTRKKFKITQGLIKREDSSIDPKCVSLKPFQRRFEKQFSKSLVKSNQSFKKKIAKQLLQQFAPTRLNPKNDFYNYINYTWLKNLEVTDKQKYIVQFDDFRLVQDRVYQELDQHIINYIKSNKNRLSTELKNFRTSVVNMNTKEDSRKLALKHVDYINEMCNTNDENKLWQLLGHINSDEMIASSAPFVWSIAPNEKQSANYCSYIYPHSFSILDINVYFDNTVYATNYKSEFRKHCKKLFDTLLGKGKHNFNPNDVLDVEIELINTYDCKDVMETKGNYNKITKNEAMEKYGFNWEELTKALGYKTTPSFFVTNSLEYLKCATALMKKKWNSEKWKTYWVWIFLRQFTRLTRDWEEITYKFHGEFQRGQEKINYSDSVSASLYMSVPFNTFLTNQYLKNHKNPKALLYVKTLCEDLKIVFMRIIKRNKWLSPKTKKYALLKLKNIEFVIGHMAKLREDPLLGYSTNLYDNMKKIHTWRHKRFIELDGKPTIDIPLMDWSSYPVKMAGNQAYVVNASYTPAKNSIFINLGYIQKPFIDMDERGIEYNLANIGFTIGHELSHALDDWGSKYDDKGNLYDWWTPKDKKIFKKMQNEVTSQYTEFAKRDKITYDAAIGIGENVADISAMAIVDEYLRDFQEKNNTLPAIRSLSYEALYTYYAFQMKQQLATNALAAQLKTNPHALDKYRTNIPLSRSQIFRALFNIKKGDKMWWNNTNTIW
jgi:putative endopeptidase